MKKVLVCVYSCVSESGVNQIGGEAELGWNLVKQLSRFFDVYAITHSNNQAAIEFKMKKENCDNVKFIYIRLPKFFSFLEKLHKGGIQIYSYLWQIKAYFIVKKLHQKNNFDSFHHITYANDWMASYIGALLPIPYIRGPGGGAHQVPYEFTKEYPLKDRLAEKLRSFGQWIFRHDPFFVIGQNKARALLVCNREAFDALPKIWQRKVNFFPVNGISLEDLKDNSNNFNHSGKFSIIIAGKLIKIKGFDLAIKSFEIFSKKNKNSKLVIIGDGPELKNLNQLTQALKIEDRVEFKKWMPRGNLLSEIDKSDIFLFPSLRDGGGQVVVEAMARGKPVICFDISGPGFHVDDKCGIKIKPDNPKQAINDIARALEKLYSNKELCLQLGANAKIKAEKYYNWNKLGDKLNDIYNRIIWLS